MVPDYQEVTRYYTTTTMQPRSLDRQEVCKTLAPCMCVDPVTGCPTTVMKTVTTLRTVTVNIMVPVEQRHEYKVRVCVMRQADALPSARPLTTPEKKPTSDGILAPMPRTNSLSSLSALSGVANLPAFDR